MSVQWDDDSYNVVPFSYQATYRAQMSVPNFSNAILPTATLVDTAGAQIWSISQSGLLPACMENVYEDC